jgi:hypothetical protein
MYEKSTVHVAGEVSSLYVLSTWIELEETWGFFWRDTCIFINLIYILAIQLNNFEEYSVITFCVAEKEISELQ